MKQFTHTTILQYFCQCNMIIQSMQEYIEMIGEKMYLHCPYRQVFWKDGRTKDKEDCLHLSFTQSVIDRLSKTNASVTFAFRWVYDARSMSKWPFPCSHGRETLQPSYKFMGILASTMLLTALWQILKNREPVATSQVDRTISVWAPHADLKVNAIF